MSRQVADDLLDMFFSLEAFAFLGNGAAATLTGIFIGPPSTPQAHPAIVDGGAVGVSCWRKGDIWTLAVPASNGTNQPVGFSSITGGIPPDATGVLMVTNSRVFFDVSATYAAAIAQFVTSANAGTWPFMFDPSDGSLMLGRVHWGSK